GAVDLVAQRAQVGQQPVGVVDVDPELPPGELDARAAAAEARGAAGAQPVAPAPGRVRGVAVPAAAAGAAPDRGRALEAVEQRRLGLLAEALGHPGAPIAGGREPAPAALARTHPRLRQPPEDRRAVEPDRPQVQLRRALAGALDLL